jgi:uncharacterized RDD family membrane protein YckC
MLLSLMHKGREISSGTSSLDPATPLPIDIFGKSSRVEISQVGTNAKVADAAATDDRSPLGEVILATRGRRLAGAVLDGLVCAVVIIPVGILVHWNPFDPTVQRNFQFGLLGWLLGTACFLGINGYLLVHRGQTIAKKVLGMKIVRPDGGRVSAFRILVLRYGAYVLARFPYSLLFGVNLWIGGLLAWIDDLLIFRDSRRCLHDVIADTIVVRS